MSEIWDQVIEWLAKMNARTEKERQDDILREKGFDPELLDKWDKMADEELERRVTLIMAGPGEEDTPCDK